MYTSHSSKDQASAELVSKNSFFRTVILLIIIAILVGIFVFLKTPTLQRLGRKHDTQRWADVNIVLNTFYAYFLEHKFFPPNVDDNLRIIGTAYDGCSVICGGKEGTPLELIHSGTGFDNGIYQNIVYNKSSNALVLEDSEKPGVYTSPIVDADLVSTWDFLGWTPYAPYGKELLDEGVKEDGYIEGDVDMDKTVTLFHFNDLIGSTIFYDSSGSYLDGLCLGSMCPTGGAEGVFHGAVLFDGGDLLAVPHDERFNAIQGFTFSMWVLPYSFPRYAPIMLKTSDDSFNDGYGMYYDGDTNDLCVFVSGNSLSVVCSPFSRRGAFSQIGGTYDGHKLSLYINGEERGSTVVDGNFKANDMPLLIGGGDNTTGWHGLIDEFVFFNKAITAREMESIYTRGVMTVKYQVRSCTNNSCSEVQFVGADNRTDTYFSESDNKNPSFSQRRLFVLSDSRYFQYRVYFETTDKRFSPRVGAIQIGYGYGGVNGEQTAEQCVNLSPFLEGKFIDKLPIDPNTGTVHRTQYAIKKTTSGRIYVEACYPEGDTTIRVVK
ncbi:MAG: LamG domain-containing protein [bacterium]